MHFSFPRVKKRKSLKPKEENKAEAKDKKKEKEKEKTKKDNIEERKLYNCKKNGKQVYEDYTEELYFVFKYNYDYHTDYYFANDVDDCEVQTKTFYRQKTVVNS